MNALLLHGNGLDELLYLAVAIVVAFVVVKLTTRDRGERSERAADAAARDEASPDDVP